MTILNQRYIRQAVKASEHNEQAAFFDWLLNMRLKGNPEVHPLFFAVPNGTHLHGDRRQRSFQMNKLKAEGLVPGVSDTVFLSGHGGYLGLALEFKTPDRKTQADGGLTGAQWEFLRAAKMEGYLSAVAYGVEEGVKIVNDYLSMPKTQQMIYSALRAAERGDLDACKAILKEVTLRW